MSSNEQKYENQGVVLQLYSPLNNSFETGKGALFQISGYCIDSTDTILSINPSIIPPVLLKLGDNEKNDYSFLGIQDCHDEIRKKYLFSYTYLVQPDDLSFEVVITVVRSHSPPVHFQIGEICPIISHMDEQKIIVQSFISSYLKDSLEQSAIIPVIIGLATYNPKIEYLVRQIDSIRHQSHRKWLCIINDDCSDITIFQKIQETIGQDPRFILCRNDRNLGFYKNFERILQYIPSDTPFIALSDQDDCWYPEKIETLLSAFDDEVTLTFSDMKIVDPDGIELYPSFWMNRVVHYEELDLQILDNAITGAACMFRGSLLRDILPFPPDAGVQFHDHKVAFHDHWIGCVALTKGAIRFISKPLYDYYQQGYNCVGYHLYLHEKGIEKIFLLLRKASRHSFKKVLYLIMKWFFTHGLQMIFFAHTLQIRKITDNKEKIDSIDLFCSLNDTWGLKWICVLWKYRTRRKVTYDSEKMFFFVTIIWRFLKKIHPGLWSHIP